MESWLVVYEVEGKTYKTEPYYSLALAWLHRNDIAGFEGVANVRIVPVTEDPSADTSEHANRRRSQA